MHQIGYIFYLKYHEMVEIGPKILFFGSFEKFFYALLRPIFYALRVYQMKDLITINISGKFHRYSACGCKSKHFKSFSFRFSTHEMAPFGYFLGPYSATYSSALLKF